MRLYQQIADDLRTQIRRGEFTPGGRLPSESMLTARYGAAQGTVRQAIAVLRAERLVVAEQGRGVFVCTDYEDHALHIACRCGEMFDSLKVANQHIFDCATHD